jgi:hypothetical protein
MAMQDLARASYPGGTGAPSTNKASSLEEILSNEAVLAGFGGEWPDPTGVWPQDLNRSARNAGRGVKVAVGKRPLMSPALIDHLEIATSPLSSAPNAGPGPPHGVVNS